MKEFFSSLSDEKIRIFRHKGKITMKMFLSFLTVETERSDSHLGRNNGWTKLTGDNGLIISGGVVDGVELLDSIQYGKNLDNPYNNYVNPFYLFDIPTDEGRVFFLEFYADDISAIIDSSLRKKIKAEEKHRKISSFWGNFCSALPR